MERQFHHWLKSQVKVSAGVRVGIGDDAAILYADRSATGGAAEHILTTDAIAEGTHFDLSTTTLFNVGRKAMGVNLSDIAAMGGTPTAAVISLMLPQQYTIEQSQQIFLGSQQLANQFETAIVGGDTNRWKGGLVIAVTILGCTNANRYDSGSKSELGENFWRLSGAKSGDRIVVSGSFGGSILGHHLQFEPRIALAKYLIEHHQINAATDVSDSLSLDLALMANASNELNPIESKLGIELFSDRVPISADAVRLSKTTGTESLIHALTDGEDFELAFAISAANLFRLQSDLELQERFVPLTEIGYFGSEPGVWLSTNDGNRQKFEPRGYSH